MQLYFGELLNGEPVHLIDCEGGEGCAPKFITESPQRFNMMEAIKRLLGTDNEEGCRKFERDADGLRLKVVHEFFPALIHSYCDILVYVSTNSSADHSWLDSAIAFGDRCAQSSRSNCMPALVLIKNQCQWPKEESERKRQLDIEGTTNSFFTEAFGITAEKVSKLKTFYNTIKCVALPYRDAYPEDYAIQIHNLKLCLGTLAQTSQLCQSLNEKTRFQLLCALVDQWNSSIPFEDSYSSEDSQKNRQPSFDTAEAYWSIFNQTENKRERAFQVMRMIYYSLRPAPPQEVSWYNKYSPSAASNYKKSLLEWKKKDLVAYHKAYHTGMILAAATQAQDLLKTPLAIVSAGSVFDQTLDRTFNEQHKLFAQLRPCQSEFKNLVCIASGFPNHERHRCYGRIWPESGDGGILEYVQDPENLDQEWVGEHSPKWWKKTVLDFARTRTWQKDVASALANINGKMDWRHDSLPFCVICLDTGSDIMLSCGHSTCKHCFEALGSSICPLCPEENNNQQIVADDLELIPKGAGIRILSLDGGGTRGVITQVILTELTKLLSDQYNLNLRDMFDFVAGTSLGALIATIFAKTDGLDPDVIQKEIIPKVFNSSLASKAGIIIHKTLTFMTAPYSSKPIQDFVDVHIGEKLLYRSDLRSIGPKLAIFTSKKSANHYTPTAFTDFVLPPNGDDVDIISPYVITIGQAVQASCSSPGYFPPVQIRGEDYLDGGIVANNPCEHAIKLAHSLWPGRSIDCIVSIGTGSAERSSKRVRPLFWLLTALIQNACDEDVVSEEVKRLYPTKYFRLNPELDTQPPLDTSDPAILECLKRYTHRYLEQKNLVMNSIVRVLVASCFYLRPDQSSLSDHYTWKIMSRASGLSPAQFSFRTTSQFSTSPVLKDEIELSGDDDYLANNVAVEVCLGSDWIPISGNPIKPNSINNSQKTQYFIPPRWRKLASMIDRQVINPPHKISEKDYHVLVHQVNTLAQLGSTLKVTSLLESLSRAEEDRIAEQLSKINSDQHKSSDYESYEYTP
eukprot:TRINITY_DN1334_c0_g1_i1.p1 TRINITY_DN1334_c0_g1~~TRINITY_DN1334_c0_g1_i1.p1  ORF type:complete len:1101 (+),score=190.00 TRINITY_DN1334_c0_g1_i1:238-3303(+)